MLDRLRPNSPPALPHRPRTPAASESAPVDQLVLNYAAFGFDADAEKPSGAHHILRQVKELAAEQKDARVALFVQGYERSPEGHWQVARYLVQGGQVTNLTEEIQGNRLLYGEGSKPYSKEVVGKEACQGGQVSMMDRDTLSNFLQDGLSRFPSARYVTFANNTHGNGSGGLAAEAIIDRQLHTRKREELPWNDCQGALVEASQAHGRKFDLITFDSCVMGQFEVLHSLTGVADRIIASPEVEAVPDSGATPSPQTLIPTFRHLIHNPETSPEETAQQLWSTTTQNKYRDYSGRELDCTPTLGIYTSQGLSEAAQPLGELGEALHQALQDPQKRVQIVAAVKDAFAYPHQSSNFFGGSAFDLSLKDLRSFLKPLQESIDPDLLGRVESSMNQAAPSFYRGKMGYDNYKRVGTVSVYLPDVPRELSIQARHATDLNEELAWQNKRGFKEESLCSDIADVLRIRRDYLQVLPDNPHAAVEAALQKHEAAFAVLQEAEKAVDGVWGKEDRAAILGPRKESLWSTLGDLREGLKEVDISGFVQSVNKRIDDGARANFQKQFTEKMRENLKDYGGIEGVPPGWMKFVGALAEVMLSEVLPEVARQAR